VLAREAEVEEVMQQAYVDAFTYLDGFRGAARFSTWLLKIGVHAALRRRRDLHRMVAASEHASLPDRAPVGSPPPGPEQACATRELLALVESAVDRLPAPYRQVLVLRAIEELDTAETADVLGVAEEVVRQRLHRARALLRQQLGGREDDGLLAAAFPFLAPRCQLVAAAVLARITTT
jgi:RNA polymerase sigma-70 factor (ECF subfamily)